MDSVEAQPHTHSPQELMDLEKAYLLQNYARYPVVLQRGKGVYVYDSSGKRYLDLISGIGVNALGYSHPRITKVIQKQAALLLHTSNLYYNEYQGPLAKRLCDASGLQRAMLSTGVPISFGVLTTENLAQAQERAAPGPGNKGAEAVHSAIVMARLLRAL